VALSGRASPATRVPGSRTLPSLGLRQRGLPFLPAGRGARAAVGRGHRHDALACPYQPGLEFREARLQRIHEDGRHPALRHRADPQAGAVGNQGGQRAGRHARLPGPIPPGGPAARGLADCWRPPRSPSRQAEGVTDHALPRPPGNRHHLPGTTRRPRQRRPGPRRPRRLQDHTGVHSSRATRRRRPRGRPVRSSPNPTSGVTRGYIVWGFCLGRWRFG
jgi:hypothetical protein